MTTIVHTPAKGPRKREPSCPLFVFWASIDTVVKKDGVYWIAREVAASDDIIKEWRPLRKKDIKRLGLDIQLEAGEKKN